MFSHSHHKGDYTKLKIFVTNLSAGTVQQIWKLKIATFEAKSL
jgi:hypothetical protein